MEIYYVNNAMQRIQLDRFPYMIQDPESLLANEWNYQTAGKIITSFDKGIATKDFTISIWADSKAEFAERMDYAVNIFESDIYAASPGWLYFGQDYLRCYMYASNYSGYEADYFATDKKIKLVTDAPFWIRDRALTFAAEESSQTEIPYLDHPYDFAYDYMPGQRGQGLVNDAVSASDFRIVIYGPCISPEILIGSQKYGVSANLENGEYLVIDSAAKKVYKMTIGGKMVNQYHLKDPNYYIFQKIPAGQSTVSWSGLFGFDITVYEKRSEPGWT